jgi:asparagine synthetase B (glutamine-hydrolysing)
MCGILGIVAAPDAPLRGPELRRALRSLFRLSESRGKESSGLAACTADAIHVYKEPRSAFFLGRSRPCEEILAAALAGPGPRCLIGHSRMATNGTPDDNTNNQPLVVDGLVGVHNGIVTNDDALWAAHPQLHRRLETDSEALLAVLGWHWRETGSVAAAARRTYPHVRGMASIAVLFDDADALLLATNIGSLHWCRSADGDVFVFASEDFFVRQLVLGQRLGCDAEDIRQLAPGTGLLLDLGTLEPTTFALTDDPATPAPPLPETRRVPRRVVVDRSAYAPEESPATRAAQRNRTVPAAFEFRPDRPYRRCTRCILPDTMPYIRFDADGVCNYCHDFDPPAPKGEAALRALVEPFRRRDGRPDCVVSLSGGRDSSFTLHYVKTVLRMHPVAFSYDWGMMTVMGRRNQSRLCAGTGTEHILISADIPAKRAYIRKNVLAWLRQPDLGTVPLFMAGDKQFYRHAYELRRQLGVALVFLGEHPLESTNFKTGFAGARMVQKHRMGYALPVLERLKLAAYYGKHYLTNPAYLNSSLLDTLDAYFSFYVLEHDYVNLYDYVPWSEERVLSTIRGGYDWEGAPDTESTWRVDDGTQAFYNYIYYTVAGLSEHDTFLCNLVRSGRLTRAAALDRSAVLNRPREQSLRWYFETIGADVSEAVRVVNAIPKRRGAAG